MPLINAHKMLGTVSGMELSAQYKLTMIIRTPTSEVILQIMFPENENIMGILYTFQG